MQAEHTSAERSSVPKSSVHFRTLKGRGLPGSSVVFRQGTNVEIGPPSFMGPADGANGVRKVLGFMIYVVIFYWLGYVETNESIFSTLSDLSLISIHSSFLYCVNFLLYR